MEYATAWRTFNFCIGLSPERPAASSDKNERRVVGDDFTVMAGTASSCLAFWGSTDHSQSTLCVISEANWESASGIVRKTSLPIWGCPFGLALKLCGLERKSVVVGKRG